jgi:hypothetical protein
LAESGKAALVEFRACTGFAAEGLCVLTASPSARESRES